MLRIQDKLQQEHERRRGCLQLGHWRRHAEEGAFQLDLEKQVHCAFVALRKEVLGEEERAGEKEQRRWVYSRQEQDDSFTCSANNVSR